MWFQVLGWFSGVRQVSLAAADCVVLLSSVPNEILSYFIVGNEWVWGRLGCALFVFVQNLGINVSSLSLTAFTVERYIAICHPMKAQSVCTVQRAKKIIAGVWAFATCYTVPWLGLTKTEPLEYIGLEPLERCRLQAVAPGVPRLLSGRPDRLLPGAV